MCTREGGSRFGCIMAVSHHETENIVVFNLSSRAFFSSRNRKIISRRNIKYRLATSLILTHHLISSAARLFVIISPSSSEAAIVSTHHHISAARFVISPSFWEAAIVSTHHHNHRLRVCL